MSAKDTGGAAVVIVYPRGQLLAEDRTALAAVGIIAVEADDPSKVVTVIPAAPLATPDDMLLSAVEAISGATLDGVSASFVRRLRDRMQARSDAMLAARKEAT